MILSEKLIHSMHMGSSTRSTIDLENCIFLLFQSDIEKNMVFQANNLVVACLESSS